MLHFDVDVESKLSCYVHSKKILFSPRRHSIALGGCCAVRTPRIIAISVTPPKAAKISD